MQLSLPFPDELWDWIRLTRYIEINIISAIGRRVGGFASAFIQNQKTEVFRSVEAIQSYAWK
jgi:hypothetical protein